MDEISSESKSIIDFDDEYSENEKQNDTPIENNISQNEKVNPNENEPIDIEKALRITSNNQIINNNYVITN